MPEGQVGGEEEARRPGEPAVAPRAVAEAAPLVPGEQTEQRERVEAAEERRRRRRHVGEPHEDRGEGDYERAEDPRQHGSISHADRE
jgi:hypothetical protein